MQERDTMVRGLQSQADVANEFLELDRHYEVLWARGLENGWAVSLEKASPNAPEGTAPYRARSMDHNVRTTYHRPIRGLNYDRDDQQTLREAIHAAETIYDNRSG